MPGQDGTGPRGMGARTGRVAGACAVADVPASMGRGRGQGHGMGRGGGRGGRGWRWMFRAIGLTDGQGAQLGSPVGSLAVAPALSEEPELAALKQQAARLQQALGELNARIGQLETPAADAGSSAEKDAR
jgi:hypothetical protein